MKSLLLNRVTYIWLFLAFLTFASWWLAEGVTLQNKSHAVYLVVGLLALAFFKVRLVIMYFMEVLDAPWLLRGIFEVWVVAVFVAMVVLYMMGVPS